MCLLESDQGAQNTLWYVCQAGTQYSTNSMSMQIQLFSSLSGGAIFLGCTECSIPTVCVQSKKKVAYAIVKLYGLGWSYSGIANLCTDENLSVSPRGVG